MTSSNKGSFEVEIKTEQQAEGIVEKLNEQERNMLLDALNKKIGVKKEDKETVEKLPELEKENFRIDSTNRKEITSPKGVRVKENPEGDVREYLEGDYKGEQLFTHPAAIRETNKAGKRLPASGQTYKDIIEKKYKGNYQNFLKGENMIFAGKRDPDFKEFYGGERFVLRCAHSGILHGPNYSNFGGDRKRPYNTIGTPLYGFSVRCLKD